jgi:hypothetical protein
MCVCVSVCVIVCVCILIAWLTVYRYIESIVTTPDYLTNVDVICASISATDTE